MECLGDGRVIYQRASSHTPFPDELPSRLIQLYTVAGETVLDPFGGSGTTMKVARNLKRNSFLYEVNSEYIDLIEENVGWNSPLDSDTRYEIKIRKSIIS
jgi:DNA modification methylase